MSVSLQVPIYVTFITALAALIITGTHGVLYKCVKELLFLYIDSRQRTESSIVCHYSAVST